MSNVFKKILCVFALTCATAWSQDRGTITGTVTDPTGATVSNAPVTARNLDTGSVSRTATTETGNFTLPALPVGPYTVSIEAPGFLTFVRDGVSVQVAQTIRLDATLAVGSASESITVEGAAPLLKTESAELSTNVRAEDMRTLPLNFGGGGGSTGGIRDPAAFSRLAPGTVGNGTGVRANGQTGTKIMLDGQDMTSGNNGSGMAYTQPSVDALEEFAFQSSNFAAEYGQIAAGVFNFTTRSGTNRYRGSIYDYFANEALDAHRPFTAIRPVSRKNDFGGSVGGPVRIPYLYNGKDKTFFFFNYEMYRTKVLAAGTSNPAGGVTGSFATVPTTAMRNGDFSAFLTGRGLRGPDGNNYLENTIFDPTTGQPFPGNMVPASRFDRVAVAVQNLFPQPTNGNQINNWFPLAENHRYQGTPSVKIDHNISSNAKLSFYYAYFSTDIIAAVDGLPAPLTAIRYGSPELLITTHTTRVNYDHTITPRLLVHWGAGYLRNYNPDSGPQSVLNYPAGAAPPTGIGFVGGYNNTGFPRMTGLSSALGGMINIGPTNGNHYFDTTITTNITTSYVSGNHTFKVGAEYARDGWADQNVRGSQGILQFGAAETALPSLGVSSFGGGSIGVPYASFLMGRANSFAINPPQDPYLRKVAYALFAQDTWKITRKLTMDYGIRWDLQTQGSEMHNRFSEFSPSVPNPAAGGRLGGLIYEGDGPKRCNCTFTTPYPYAIAPRLGVAYQVAPKTVLRGGVGVTYSKLAGYGYFTNNAILGVGFNQLTFDSPTFGTPGAILQNGVHYNQGDLTAVTLDPGAAPLKGQVNAPQTFLDRNGARPGRILQWNITLQREIGKGLTVEAGYVGNRGVWLTASNLVPYNVLDPAQLKARGIDLSVAADRTLLTSPIGSVPAATLAGRGISLPYSAFPQGQTVAQALRPFPQYNSNLAPSWAPVGNNWYDSLQTRVTKRTSYGLDATLAFTWQKNLALGAAGSGAINNVFNRPIQKGLTNDSQPLVLVTSFNYMTPSFGIKNRLLRDVVHGWTLGGILRYASGTPIPTPAAISNLASYVFQNTLQNRVPGVPLFLKDLNCHCIDPNKDFVLNPAAWVDPGPGNWGSSAAYYGDFRYARRPSEQLSLGRDFRYSERMTFSVRAEFFNVFNRTYLADPTATNPSGSQVRDPRTGVPLSGYGRIDATAIQSTPRNGQIVARISF